MFPYAERAASLFDRALDFDPAERAAFLAGACGNDVNLRRRVEDLLLAHEAKSGFLPQESVQPEGRESDPPQPLTMSMATPLTEGAGTLIDRYKLLEKLGEGGFGAVWAAEQREPVKRRVALKIIKLGMDTGQVVARFEAERQALALMDHPNIAKVLDAGSTDTGRPYFVMELVRGIPITRYCDQEKLATGDRLDLFMKVCHAIQHAHQKGIIHRDIKPSNILVTLHDGVPVPKVIDFGIAKATQQELTEKTIYTQFQQFIGTPAYMSPEQAEMSGLDIDTRSDIYSLGVLLYELLTGATPFDAKELMRSGLDEMRKIIREREPLKPSSRLTQELTTLKNSPSNPSALRIPHSTVDRDLDWITMKCLEKDRARRYETANGLAADLKRHLNNEPIVARPPSAGYRLLKAWRRNRVAFCAAAAVLVALTLGITVSTWQAVEASRAKHNAVTAERAERQRGIELKEQRDRADAARASAEAEGRRARRHAYAATMRLVPQEWANLNVGRIHRLLTEAQQYDTPAFEWHFWHRLLHQNEQAYVDRAVPVTAIALSADGRRLFVGREDGTLEIRTATDGHVERLIQAHADAISAVAVSPDGTWLATGSWAATTKIWDARNGLEIHCLKGHAAPVLEVAFSPDGSLVATVGWDGTARTWEVPSFKQRSVFGGQDATIAINCIAFSPTGDRFATGGSHGTATVWDPVSGKPLLRLALDAANWLVGAVAYSPDGTQIAVAPPFWDSGPTCIWDASTGALNARINTGGLRSLRFLPENMLATAGNSSLTLWSISVGGPIQRFAGHSGWIAGLCVMPDGSGFITGGEDGSIRLWPQMVAGFSRSAQVDSSVTSVTLSPDGHRIYSGHSDGKILIRNSHDLWEIHSLIAHSDIVSALATSPDGRWLLSGSEDRSVRVADAVTGQELHRFADHAERVREVGFSSDGELAFSGALDGKVYIWSPRSGKRLGVVENPFGVDAAAFARGGTHLALGLNDGTLKVVEWRQNITIWQTSEHQGPVMAVACSPDGSRVVSGGVDGVIRVCDFDSGNIEAEFRGHEWWIEHVAFSPDGRRLFSAAADGTIRIWDARSGQELLVLDDRESGERQPAFERRVASFALSRDGTRAVSGDATGVLRIWETASAADVERWREVEEQAARQHQVRDAELASQNRAHAESLARGDGVINEWLVLAPLPYEPGEMAVSGNAALNSQQIADERHLMPTDGTEVEVNGERLQWGRAKTDPYLLDFNSVLGTTHTYSAAYAVSYIDSEYPQTDLLLKVGCDDQAMVYLNGVQLSLWRNATGLSPDSNVIEEVALKEGINTLVFKVINERGGWQGCMRITDRDGNPVKGIRVTIDP